jgi:hypothetical protein
VLPLSAIPWWWKHVDFFMEVAMEEGIVHIHLMKRPIRDRGNGEKAADSNKFGNRGKGFSIVDALPLVETLSDQPGFVPLNGTVRPIFGFENPFAANGAMTGR